MPKSTANHPEAAPALPAPETGSTEAQPLPQAFEDHNRTESYHPWGDDYTQYLPNKPDSGNKLAGYPEGMYWAADSLVVAYDQASRPHILLIKRGAKRDAGQPPSYALPGGFKDSGETDRQAALRELGEETQLIVGSDDPAVTITQMYKGPADDPRNCQRVAMATSVHLVRLSGQDALPQVTGSDDAKEALWVPVAGLQEFMRKNQLFGSHADLIQHALSQDEALAGHLCPDSKERARYQDPDYIRQQAILRAKARHDERRRVAQDEHIQTARNAALAAASPAPPKAAQ